MWQGKRVLVTGAGGFIGSHLTERLVELGATVRAFVHYRGDGSWGWLDTSPLKEELEVVAGDLADRDLVLQAVQGTEVVFHLAALIAIPYSYQAPSSFVQTNVVGTLNVLQAARAGGVGRVVHTSTSEVYGTAQYVPMDEAHPLQAQSPYAASKIGADKLAESFWRSYELPVVTIRPFNTFGPRQSARAIIPTIITQGLGNGTVRLGNLSPKRDLNYVSDTVEGFVLAATVPEAVGRAINLGSGRETSIGELARMILTRLGKAGAVEQEAQRLRPQGSEVERLLADTTLAQQLLGWKPAVSLEEGLRRTIEWLEEHQTLYRTQQYAM
ncbi:MAG: SDR family NAD(P)-dependent oxidoreductase [Candidatus Omnitrophica bacterium]|nr:SDR family NAD(P)-dependent oxidoreductase [Candidatus Omnitrophota bacterium]